MIGNVNTYLTNPGSNNPQKVIDYYSNSDFEYNIRVGDYCKVTLDSNLLYWISGIVVEIDEEENAFSIKDSNGSVTKISCDNICDIQSYTVRRRIAGLLINHIRTGSQKGEIKKL